jgi:hypothetical protein
MFNIDEMADEVKDFYRWQDTPYPVSKSDYIKFVVNAIKKLFVDRNRPNEYNRSAYTTDEDDVVYYDGDFDIIQEEYIFILCKLQLMRMIMSDLSGDKAMSYTTNALSVTGAKEGYKSVQQEIDDLERERLIVFHKMMVNESD